MNKVQGGPSIPSDFLPPEGSLESNPTDGNELAQGAIYPLEQDVVLEEDDSGDLYWSAVSNGFFLAGGISYIMMASWDLTGAPETPDDPLNSIYAGGWVFGALMYLLNSMVDIVWSIRASRRKAVLRLLKEQREREIAAAESAEDNDFVYDEKTPKKRRRRFRPRVLIRRMRNNMGHRREVTAAVSFGLAASFGLWGCFATNENSVFVLGALSVHLYMVSAICALVGRAPSTSSVPFCRTFYNTERLEDIGDILFGIGCVMDMLLFDFTFDDKVIWWPVFSALLWFTDALLYVRADYVAFVWQGEKQFDFVQDEGIVVASTNENPSDSQNKSWCHLGIVT